MIGHLVGRSIGNALVEKYFPEEGRIASLDFDYSPAELDELRSGTLPAPGQAILAAKKQRRAARQRKLAIAGGLPVLLVFGAYALSADVSTNTQWAVFLLGAGFVLIVNILGAVLRWYQWGRHAKPSCLREYTAVAVKKFRSHTIRFGKADAAPSWNFSSADAGMIDNGAEYRVHHVHDVLVYLEELSPAPVDAN